MRQSASQNRALEFLLAHVDSSRRYKSQYVDLWRELLANWMVEPEGYGSSESDDPYRTGGIYRNRKIILKDPETYKIVMTYASHMVLGALGDQRGEYVQAKPVGWEDAPEKAPTCTKLMRHMFGVPGNFRTMVEAVFDMLIFGTAIVEVPWVYREREQLVRSINAFGEDVFTYETVIQRDDVYLSVVDNQDFFPDPSNSRLENMNGAAKKFRITAMGAKEKVEQGLWDSAAVNLAVSQLGEMKSSTDHCSESEDMFREGLDQPYYRDAPADFKQMVGFAYWGDTPWGGRRVIEALNGFTVRDDRYPFADSDLPFRALIINPVTGRFYGKSPAEVIRFDQSLQDAIKILLAEAMIRAVHPPMIYDANSEIDLNKLLRFGVDVPIQAIGGPNAVGTLRYDANLFGGFQYTRELKQSMQEAVAPAISQGLGLPNSRSSATEAQVTDQRASQRFELGSMLLEREGLPSIALSGLRRYQQFLDEEGLAHRIGEQPRPYMLNDIFGDFDIKFVGSRLSMSRQEKLQAYDRLVSLTGAVPEARAMVPWSSLLTRLIGEELELPEVASLIGTPETMQMNMLLAAMSGQMGGAGANGVPTRGKPPGQLPAQAFGSVAS